MKITCDKQTMISIQKRLLWLAASSRFMLMLLQCLVNYLQEDFDSSTFIDLYRERSAHDTFLFLIVDGLNKWDAVYFNHISLKGYTYEQMLAFYPGFPYLASAGSYIPVVPTLVGIQLTALFMNCVLFIMSCYYLFELTLAVSSDRKLAAFAVFGLLINPANVFMLSSYSESFFLCLQMYLLYNLENNKYFMASILVSLSILIRSNGILNIVFLTYFYVKNSIKTQMRTHRSRNKLVDITKILLPMAFDSFLLSKLPLYISICLFPYVAWQYHIYSVYCEFDFTNADHWCGAALPLSYSYVQKKYWNVGFLRYYEFKQIPNFLLALPVVSLCLYAMCSILSSPGSFDIIRTLGLVRKANLFNKREQKQQQEIIPADRALVYIMHACFLVVAGTLGFHVQILTRMLCSSSPVIYWLFGSVVLQHLHGRKSDLLMVIVSYFLLYNVLGFFLHCNFYPWT